MGLKLKRMNAGDGATSYTNNSGLQKVVISKTWCVLEESLEDMFRSCINININGGGVIRVADVGCGPGPNTLLVVCHVMETIKRLFKYKELPQVEVFLNDLPGNDFNTLFKSLYQRKHHQLLDDACFIYAAPGSFHGHLFPTNTLHFVYSSYSLHWLSRVPEGVGKNNKENIHISMTSPPHVFEAYGKQFQTDFSRFLSIRGKEVVGGGRMVLTLIGRRFVDVSPNDGLINIYLPLAHILLHMVAQGIIKEEDLYSFNVPVYTPSTQEIEAIIRSEGSFVDDDVHFDKHVSGTTVAACVRAFIEPLLVSHFGPALNIDAVFDIYTHKMGDILAAQRPSYFSPVIALTRKG